MWRHPVLKVVLGAYVAWGAWNWIIDRPVQPGDGILAAGDPQQEEVAARDARVVGDWTLTTRATYRITARILHVERYHFDRLASLVPEDLALGWGPMSDNHTLKFVDISQSDRFYFWHLSDKALIPKDIIISHSANTHVIPESRAVARQLARLRAGQVVTLSGVLVDAAREDGAWIRTSLVRTDTGAGACEVMLVRDVTVE